MILISQKKIVRTSDRICRNNMQYIDLLENWIQMVDPLIQKFDTIHIQHRFDKTMAFQHMHLLDDSNHFDDKK